MKPVGILGDWNIQNSFPPGDCECQLLLEQKWRHLSSPPHPGCKYRAATLQNNPCIVFIPKYLPEFFMSQHCNTHNTSVLLIVACYVTSLVIIKISYCLFYLLLLFSLDVPGSSGFRGYSQGGKCCETWRQNALKAAFRGGNLFLLWWNGATCRNRETLLGALHCSEQGNMLQRGHTGSDITSFSYITS